MNMRITVVMLLRVHNSNAVRAALAKARMSSNSKNRKQFQQLGSFRVIKNGAIRQNIYHIMCGAKGPRFIVLFK